jgi:DNA topoisomerase-2
LVNGALGIGTGFSCYIPNYNPIDIIKCVKKWINKKNFLNIIPWYKNFKGEIEEVSDTRYICSGVYTEENERIIISELPIGTSTDNFKSRLENLEDEKKIKSIINHSTKDEVKFTITKIDKNEDLERDLKLFSYLQTSNMVLFQKNKMLKKYSSIQDIINEFCETRLEYYILRKKKQIELYLKELNHLKNKLRFIVCVTQQELVLNNKEEEELNKELEKMKFDREDDKYNYLLNIRIKNFTKTGIEQLENEIKCLNLKIETLQKTTEQSIWLSEIDELEIALKDFPHNKN